MTRRVLGLRPIQAAVALVLLLAVSGAIGAGAQTTTPTPTESPFQTVRVDSFAYGVDPYFPCVAFITRRLTELDPERGPVTTITMLLFIRDAAGQRQPTEPYDTPETELTATAAVGQAWTCGPQDAIESEAGDG